ncbi:hypothetical protein [Nitrososphaera sp.]|uniref:hypothetical protein n=1 Tax=Nitrososphaera sp. TaxID=1971748 RepID=UPI00307FCB96
MRAGGTTSTRIGQDELLKKLESLDIDEGIRVELGGGRKMFVNRSPSGTFVVQFAGGPPQKGSSDAREKKEKESIRYFDSAKEVARLARGAVAAWAY